MTKKAVEAILFASGKPVALHDLSHFLEEEESVVLRWVIELKEEYSERGIHIRQVAKGFEMVTSEECSVFLERFLPKKQTKLSRAAIETASIVLQKQPVTRKEIAHIRKVENPDYGISLLENLGLIKETEQGYCETNKFPLFFGVNDTKMLKPDKKNRRDSYETEEETSQT